MKLKLITGIVLALFLIGMLTFAFNIQPVKASRTIYIRADGSVEGTDKIQRVGNVYTFTDNINDSIVVERSNIIVDGDGYTLQGTGGGTGIILSDRSNVTIKNMKIKAFWLGIFSEFSDNNTISGNNITNNGDAGILLFSSDNCIISGNNITNNSMDGIRLSEYSNYNSIYGNNITANEVHGIYLQISNYNSIYGNNIANNKYGIELGYSSNNSVSGNNITANEVHGIWLDYFSNYNSICGNNITASNSLSVYLYWRSDYNSMVGNNIANNGLGIGLRESSNYNSICGNNITANKGLGVYLDRRSNYNSIYGNNIANNARGIRLEDSSNNSISGNNIAKNHCGVDLLVYSLNNKFYHNNFINNNITYVTTGYTNIWDDGYPSGGNYWSDYTGTDSNGDGIGDTPYIIDENNRDRYPLMNPWTPIETSVKVKGKDYPVTIVSNTTIDQIVATSNTLNFKSSGPAGEKGYVNVIFPMVNTTEIKVFIDGKKLTPPPFPVINTNGTHYFIYFEFTLSTHDIEIQFAPKIPVGGTVIPVNKLELLMPYISVVSVILAAIIVVVKKRKLNHIKG